MNKIIKVDIDLSNDNDKFNHHIVFSVGVYPATGYIDLVNGQLRQGFIDDESNDYIFYDICLLNPLHQENAVQLEVSGEGNFYQFKIKSCDSENEIIYCLGKIEKTYNTLKPTRLSKALLLQPTSLFDKELDEGSIYKLFEQRSIGYKKDFKTISSMKICENESLAKISLGSRVLKSNFDLWGYDSAIQCALMHYFSTNDSGNTKVPFTIEKLSIYNAMPNEFYVKATCLEVSKKNDFAVYDLYLYTEEGELIAEVSKLSIKDFIEEQSQSLDICIASSFTCEPILQKFKLDLKSFNISADVRFSPYQQLMQELLSPNTSLSIESTGVNLFLIRLEDFLYQKEKNSNELTSIEMTAFFEKYKHFKLPNKKVIAHLNDYETKYLYKEIFLDKVYEKNGIFIQEGDTIFDVGANIGMFALSVVERLATTKIYSFEPSPKAYQALTINAQVHGHSQIIPCNYGISDSDCQKTFTYYPNSSVWSGFHTDTAQDEISIRAAIRNSLKEKKGLSNAEDIEEFVDLFMKDRLKKETFKCSLRSISSVIQEYNIEKIDLLKVDAEKCEWEILNGLTENDWKKVKQIVVEVHDQKNEQLPKIQKLLTENGFNLSFSQEEALENSGLYNIYATKERGIDNQRQFDTELLNSFDELVFGLKNFVIDHNNHAIVCVCPPSPQMMKDYPNTVSLTLLNDLTNQFSKEKNIDFMVLSDFSDIPDKEYYDESRNLLGNIPYQPSYYDFISMMLTKNIAMLKQSLFKVIAIDADGTLWKGICGEEMPLDMDISPAFKYLQEFILEQSKRGVLLCLVSKNHVDDVKNVFIKNDSMVLNWEDISAFRVNWQPKSSNLISIASELNLSLDSFIFLDDNPMECAEVRKRCPEVLTLNLPASEEDIPSFLDRIVFFTDKNVTSEDVRRGQMYQENKVRNQHRTTFISLKSYIENLELKIEFEDINKSNIKRVAQLTARTNQFNIHKNSRTQLDLEQILSKPNYSGFVVRVTDRFGSYGLTGALIYERHDKYVKVDAFLLSCRVLGKGVEHALVAKLGDVVSKEGISIVKIPFVKSSKNEPIYNFLSSMNNNSIYTVQGEIIYEFNSLYIADLEFDPELIYTKVKYEDLPSFPTTEDGEAIALPMTPEEIQNVDTDFSLSFSSYLIEVFADVTKIPEKEIVSSLRYEAIGIDSFALVELAVRLEKDFGSLPKTLLFDHLTIQKLCEYFNQYHQERTKLLTQRTSVIDSQVIVYDKPSLPEFIIDTGIEHNITHKTLSYNQESMWVTHRMEKGLLANNVPLVILLRDSVDVAALSKSLEVIMSRHKVLRSQFIEVDGIGKYVIGDLPNVEIPLVDLSFYSSDKRSIHVKKFVDEESSTPFEITSDYPIRTKLLKLNDKRYVFLMTLHHLVCDGWSIRILFHELSLMYKSMVSGEKLLIKPLKYQYEDFAMWQRQQVKSGKFDKQLSFWEKTLKGVPPLIKLPVDYPRPQIRSYASEVHSFSIPKMLRDDLLLLQKESECTLHTILLSVFNLLLHRYSGQNDIVVGVPVANRDTGHFRDAIGYFVNTLVNRTQFSQSLSFRDLLAQTSQYKRMAQDNLEIPFSILIDKLKLKKGSSYSPLVQVIFTFHNTPIENEALMNSQFSFLDCQILESQFDLRLEIESVGGELNGRFEYSKDLFKAETIEQFSKHFITLLQEISFEPDKLLYQYNFLSESEKNQQLNEWNDTKKSYPNGHCIHELFEQQVNKTPNAIAVVFEEQQLSFRELNERSNQLAHYLINQDVCLEDRIGICVERSFEMIIGLLGILKAGCCYVPLDPEYPETRLEHMMQDSNCQIILSESHLFTSFSFLSSKKIIPLDSRLQESIFGQYSKTNICPTDIGLSIHNLAYIIYTSGSTGTPKGVGIGHLGWSNLTNAQIDLFGINQSSRLLQFFSLSFDVAASEISMSLTSGATLCLLASNECKNPERLTDIINRNQLTHVTLPPVILTHLNPGEISLAKTMIIGGESMSNELATLWSQGRYLYCAYGPTETTVCTTAGLYESGSPKIGRPLANQHCYVLDKMGGMVPVGVIGELFIGGVQLSRGYFNRSSLTAERFVPNPYSQLSGDRLYRTGDLVRYLSSGELEFVSRIDNQVKVRGFRIELSEIERVLMRHSAVNTATVIVREDDDGDKRLVAYIATDLKTVENPKKVQLSLLSIMQATLPEYMIPGAIIILELFPLTVNGKVDREALPKPDNEAYARVEHIAPQSDAEKILAKLWQDNLGIELIGLEDNYFEMGGDSLLAVSLGAESKKQGLLFSIDDLFANPTITELVKVTSFEKEGQLIFEDIVPFALLVDEEKEYLSKQFDFNDIEDIYPLSKLQQGMLYHSMLQGHLGVYHNVMQYIVKLEWDEIVFDKALQYIVHKHAAFRTLFLLEGERPLQLVFKNIKAEFKVIDIRGLDKSSENDAISNWMQEEKEVGINVSSSLWRFTIHLLSDNRISLGLVVHHALLDGWSDSILVTELLSTFSQYQNYGYVAPAKALPSYSNFVKEEQLAISSQQIQERWTNKLSELTLPWWSDNKKENNISFNYDVSEELSRTLSLLANSLGVQEKSLWCSIYLMLMSLLDGTNDVIGSVVTHGRPEISGSDKMIGLFLNSLPIRLHLEGMNWSDLIKETENELRELHALRHYPLSSIQSETGLDFSASLFNYMNFRLYEASDNEHHIESSGGLNEVNYLFTFYVQKSEKTQRHSINISVPPSSFGGEFRERIKCYIDNIIEQIVSNTTTEINKNRLLKHQNIEQPLHREWQTDFYSPQHLCIHELFEMQVENSLESIALVYKEQALSYGELNCRSNQLAHYLNEQEVGLEARVAICMEPSIEMVIGILGILKSGACYVPIDPTDPQARIDYILEDSEAIIVVTQSSLLKNIPLAKRTSFVQNNILCLDDNETKNTFKRYPNTNPINYCSTFGANNLAYIIYTSGTTGEPKGVMQTHQTVVNLVYSQKSKGVLNFSTNMLQMASISFDVAIQEITTAWITHSKLILLPNSIRLNADLVTELINDQNVGRLFLSPAMFYFLFQNKKINKSIKEIIVAGEQLRLSKELLENISSSEVKLLNHYGPTETHVATSFDIRSGSDECYLPPIGRAMDGHQIYILSQALDMLPAGVPGELCISGNGLARCYLNKPSLTAEKFLPNPYSQVAGARLYRTGDIVQCLPNSEMVFIERLDNQVKVRGFRIELNEIETKLSRHELVHSCVVIVREDVEGDKRIVAYVVLVASENGTSKEKGNYPNLLQAYLRLLLPDYMIPSAFVECESLPYTRNGKLNRADLPLPNSNAYVQNEYSVCEGIVEEKLASLWSKILVLELVGRNDNFFELGGHSLLATQLVYQIREIFEVEVALSELFNNPELKNMALHINSQMKFNALDVDLIDSMSEQEIESLLKEIERVG